MHDTLDHLRETRKNKYWAVVCKVFRVAIYENGVTLAIFIFSEKPLL